jgi:LuxR family maltose regulon positive regulatory protein
LPIQQAKVQRPPLRAATLRRPRLIQWLEENIHRRVILVTAEAGYGKTTLLADFARGTKQRILWYRIDDDDSNWVKCEVCRGVWRANGGHEPI